MPAYVVVNLTVEDHDRYELYKPDAARTVAAFGGRSLVRGGRVDVLEGDFHPDRYVILEFPDLARARAWYDSPEYAGLKALRKETTRSQLFMVEGVAGQP